VIGINRLFPFGRFAAVAGEPMGRVDLAAPVASAAPAELDQRRVAPACGDEALQVGIGLMLAVLAGQHDPHETCARRFETPGQGPGSCLRSRPVLGRGKKRATVLCSVLFQSTIYNYR